MLGWSKVSGEPQGINVLRGREMELGALPQSRAGVGRPLGKKKGQQQLTRFLAFRSCKSQKEGRRM